MFTRLFGLLFAILLQYFAISVAVRTWNYEFLSVSIVSSDETKLNASLRVERVARGGSVLTGTMDWNFDTDDETEADFILYHSQSGRNDDYFETPYKVKNVKFTEGINKIYDDVIYQNFKHCTNLEKLTPGFVPPFPRKMYVLNQCFPKTNGFPDVLPIEYYKIFITIRGQVEIDLTFILKLKPKL